MCVLCLYAKVFCIVYSRSFLPPPSVFLSHEVELLICVLGVLIMCYSICWQNLDETSFFSHSCNSTEWKKAELGFLLCTQIRLLLCGRLYLRPSMGMWNFRFSGQGTILRFLQSFFKVSSESHWSLFGVYLEFLWSLFGVSSESLRSLFKVTSESLRSLYGVFSDCLGGVF